MLRDKPLAIDPTIFRAYDIRGIVGEGLNVRTVNLIGKAIAAKLLALGDNQIMVARDGRLSGPVLMHALIDGLLSSGCDVIDMGMVPTPVLYFATHHTHINSGVMLTGSHNPGNYNGLKIVLQGKALAEDSIQQLYHRMLAKDFVSGMGMYTELNIVPDYLQKIIEDVTVQRNLKVVVDCGNSVPGLIAPQLLQALGCEVIALHCEVDGHFPNHHPDPSQPENLQDLLHEVKVHNADVGLAFDGDGDRLGVVTPLGEIIWPDRQMMLLAKSVLQHSPGATIIYDVKCSNHLAAVIKSLGGVPLMWKTGHSFIKEKLLETQAKFAGEMSGHLFFKDRWYGFDDALYAAARFLESLSQTDQTIDEIFSKLPNSKNTPELKVAVADSEKFALMRRLIEQANFTTATEINTIDGLRVHFEQGWALVRISNTTPCLVMRFEAETETILESIKQQFKMFMLAVEPLLELPY